MSAQRPSLASYGLFAATLAAAGLPIYIHAPKVYVDEYGVSLASLGLVLAGLRLLDVVQDPLLGRLAGRLQGQRGLAVALAVAVMAAAMLGLFAIAPPIAPLVWFALMLAGVFSAFSFLTICFYAQGVACAPQLGPQGFLQLARWRETGALLGICLAAVAPLALGGFGAFAICFALACAGAAWAMRREWRPIALPDLGFGVVLADPVARRLLLVALVNAAPVAISSTLFLFFVESRLDAPGAEGPLLLLFFLAAAASAPIWAKLATRHGPRTVLLWGMVLAIAAFSGAVFLGAGDVAAFALICLASGVALGADMTLLPALFAHRMEKVAPAAAGAFGLWSFVSKFTLAFAALLLLPTLQSVGFVPGATNNTEALFVLSLAYGALPCVLKLIAIALVATLKTDEIE